MRLGCTCDRGAHAWGKPYDKAIHCGPCWLFWHNKDINLARGGDGRVRTVTRVPYELPLFGCGGRGEQVGTGTCKTCTGSIQVPLRTCSILGGTCYTGSYMVPGSTACDRCPKRGSPAPGDPRCGVVIGSYGWPRSVEANIKLIRKTCGNVPILVSEDKQEDQSLIRAICAENNVDLVFTPKRLGHVGGDAAAFGHGLLWAQDRGLEVIAKLSFRVWWLKERWLQTGATELLKTDLPLATRCGNFGEFRNFPLRSESVLLKVGSIDPATFFNESTWHPLNGEELLYAALPGTKYAEWTALPESRLTRVPYLITHWTHDTAEYRQVSSRSVGVILDEGFHSGGWENEDARGEYLWG